MKIVTSGYNFVDIDALACAYAYAELLNVQGHDAKAVITAPYNQSIPPTVRGWDWAITRKYVSQPKDSFVIVDISDPEAVEKFVKQDAIETIIDHHSGYEAYWNKIQGVNSYIIPVGAAATLVYEKWQNSELITKISQISCRLLLTAIVDNTLCFKANVCTNRDLVAYNYLLAQSGLENNWPKEYLKECQDIIEKDLDQSFNLDAKILRLANPPGHVFCSQLVIYDEYSFLKKNKKIIMQKLNNHRLPAFASIVCIANNKTYFVTQNTKIKAWLERLLEAQFTDNIASVNRLWLRKEIVKKANQLYR